MKSQLLTDISTRLPVKFMIQTLYQEFFVSSIYELHIYYCGSIFELQKTDFLTLLFITVHTVKKNLSHDHVIEMTNKNQPIFSVLQNVR